MPAMPRPSGKAKKVAYDILGEPPALKDDRKRKHRKIDEHLEAEDTRLIKGISGWPRRA